MSGSGKPAKNKATAPADNDATDSLSGFSRLRKDRQSDFNAQRLFDVLRELRRGSFRSLYDELYGEGDQALEPAQYDALELLLTEADWRMTDFARLLGVDPSTATRMVDRLVKAGVAARVPSSVDGRGVVIRGTRAGRLRRTHVVEGRRQLMREFIEVFEDEELNALIELMERLADRMAEVADERAVRAATADQSSVRSRDHDGDTE